MEIQAQSQSQIVKFKLLIVAPKNTPAIQLISNKNLTQYFEYDVMNSLDDIFALKSPTDYFACFLIDTDTSLGIPLISQVVEEILIRSPKIKWLHISTAGIDYLNTQKIRQLTKNISVTNSKGAYNQSLAEFCLLSILYFAKKIPQIMKNKSQKLYEKVIVKTLLNNYKVAIVGYGSIGKSVAKLIKNSINATIYGIKNSIKLTPEPQNIADFIYTQAELSEILPKVDCVINILPYTSQTHYIFNKDLFNKMKQGAIFINIGRGKTVCEKDLIDAMQTGKISGAALDVFENEPLNSDNKLYELENCIISPHTMAETEDGWDLVVDAFEKELNNFVNNKSFENIITFDKGY